MPISDTGTASNGISVARQLCRNRYTTRNTSSIASPSVITTSRIETSTKRVVSYTTEWREPVGEPRREVVRPRRFTLLANVQRVRAGLQEDADEGRLAPVHAADELVVLRAELDARDVLQAQDRAVGVRADDDVLELLRLGEPALGGDGVDELLRPAGRRLADLAGGELRVLLVDRAHRRRRW